MSGLVHHPRSIRQSLRGKDGENQIFLIEEGQRLAAAMPNARFVALESENHLPVPGEAAWPTFLAEIDAFLQE